MSDKLKPRRKAQGKIPKKFKPKSGWAATRFKFGSKKRQVDF